MPVPSSRREQSGTPGVPAAPPGRGLSPGGGRYLQQGDRAGEVPQGQELFQLRHLLPFLLPPVSRRRGTPHGRLGPGEHLGREQSGAGSERGPGGASPPEVGGSTAPAPAPRPRPAASHHPAAGPGAPRFADGAVARVTAGRRKAAAQTRARRRTGAGWRRAPPPGVPPPLRPAAVSVATAERGIGPSVSLPSCRHPGHAEPWDLWSNSSCWH